MKTLVLGDTGFESGPCLVEILIAEGAGGPRAQPRRHPGRRSSCRPGVARLVADRSDAMLDRRGPGRQSAGGTRSSTATGVAKVVGRRRPRRRRRTAGRLRPFRPLRLRFVAEPVPDDRCLPVARGQPGRGTGRHRLRRFRRPRPSAPCLPATSFAVPGYDRTTSRHLRPVIQQHPRHGENVIRRLYQRRPVLLPVPRPGGRLLTGMSTTCCCGAAPHGSVSGRDRRVLKRDHRRGHERGLRRHAGRRGGRGAGRRAAVRRSRREARTARCSPGCSPRSIMQCSTPERSPGFWASGRWTTWGSVYAQNVRAVPPVRRGRGGPGAVGFAPRPARWTSPSRLRSPWWRQPENPAYLKGGRTGRRHGASDGSTVRRSPTCCRCYTSALDAELLGAVRDPAPPPPRPRSSTWADAWSYPRRSLACSKGALEPAGRLRAPARIRHRRRRRPHRRRHLLLPGAARAHRNPGR